MVDLMIEGKKASMFDCFDPVRAFNGELYIRARIGKINDEPCKSIIILVPIDLFKHAVTESRLFEILTSKETVTLGDDYLKKFDPNFILPPKEVTVHGEEYILVLNTKNKPDNVTWSDLIASLKDFTVIKTMNNSGRK